MELLSASHNKANIGRQTGIFSASWLLSINKANAPGLSLCFNLPNGNNKL